jgi:hypothetical protein
MRGPPGSLNILHAHAGIAFLRIEARYFARSSNVLCGGKAQPHNPRTIIQRYFCNEALPNDAVWKNQLEVRLAIDSLNVDVSVVGIDDLFDDRQTKTKTLGLVSGGKRFE